MSDGGLPPAAVPPAARLLHAALRREVGPENLRVIATEGRNPALRLAAILEWLEGHGVARLMVARLLQAGVSLPAAVRDRDAALSEWSGRTEATRALLERHLASEGVRVIRLKGASLVHDAWPAERLRQSGDLDLLVLPGDRRRARRLLCELGFGLSPRQLPAWWYTLTHFHLKLRHLPGMLAETELHWHLHSPAAMFGVRRHELWSRSRPVSNASPEVRTLDALDRFLHVATHLLRHSALLPDGQGATLFENLLRRAPAPGGARLKWILDLVFAAELLRTSHEPAELAARARDWGADRELAEAAGLCVRSGLSSAEAARWLGALAPSGVRPGGGTHRREEPDPGAPHPALDLRVAALRRWPAWLLPPLHRLRVWLGLRDGVSGSLAALVAYPFHSAGVLLRTAAAALLLPAAIVGRALAAPHRRRAAREAHTPDRIMSLAAALGRSEATSGTPGAGAGGRA